jgi:hypothetical protein
MNVKQAIQALQTMIDTGEITGEEEFGVYEYSPEEGIYFHSPLEFESYIDEDTEETVVYF